MPVPKSPWATPRHAKGRAPPRAVFRTSHRLARRAARARCRAGSLSGPSAAPQEKMRRQPGHKRRVRIVQPAPRVRRLPLSDGGPADRPRGSLIAAEPSDEPARRVPGEGLLRAFVPNERTKPHAPVVDAVRAPRSYAIFSGFTFPALRF